MNSLNLAGLDQPLTPVVLGTMTFGDSVDERTAAQMIDDFLAAGGTGIDTANGYAGGRSETMLARLLGDHRDQVVLATKVGIPHPDADDTPPLSIEGIRRCVAGSLHRLNTDHVDLLYLHQPDRATPIGQTLTVLQELLDNGDIRAWGVSNFAAWQIAELRYTAADLGNPDPVIAQQIYKRCGDSPRRRVRRIRLRHLAAHRHLQPARRRPAHGQTLTARRTPDRSIRRHRPGRRVPGPLLEQHRLHGLGRLADAGPDRGSPTCRTGAALGHQPCELPNYLAPS